MPVNPLSLISTIVDDLEKLQSLAGQSSFFNFYYCRSSGTVLPVLRCQSSFFNFYYCRLFVKVNHGVAVNPLSLISTIVDARLLINFNLCQSSFFNFYYCRFTFFIWSFLSQSSFFNFYYCRFNKNILYEIIRQSSFFNFYYCRYQSELDQSDTSILFL